MSVTAPSKPPRQSDPADYRELEALVNALIEEARQRARRRRRRITAFALFAIAAGICVYFGIARATARSGSTTAAPHAAIATRATVHNGPLTLFVPASNRLSGPVSRIVTVGAGQSKTIWLCPHVIWCGQAVSFDWAPDGKRLAFSLDEIGGNSTYVGLHVVNVATGQDVHVPPATPAADAPRASWDRYLQAMLERVGCWPATEIDWSADGTSLAYGCTAGIGSGNKPTHLNVLRLTGAGHTTIRTGTSAHWPSWSPTSKRIAYSTALRPNPQSGIFSIALDGRHKKLLATGGAAPAWSPSGNVIAYQTRCGIRIVTPLGTDVTPRQHLNTCRAIGTSGPPVWSPDGTKLAVETRKGIYVMDASGAHFHLVSRASTTTWYGSLPGRPSWRPLQ
jgi:dipeptidyl aminopeptidase/acylaminoacyl peptidase